MIRNDLVEMKEDAELLVLLFRKKTTSIYAHSSLFAILPPAACPAESLNCICVAESPPPANRGHKMVYMEQKEGSRHFAVHPDVRQTPKRV